MNFSEFNSETKTLPTPLTTGTEGNSASYSSKNDAYVLKGGKKKSKSRKSRKSRDSKKSKESEEPKKSKKSKKSKKRECKEINIYM